MIGAVDLLEHRSWPVSISPNHFAGVIERAAYCMQVGS
jgi:hypothetical protein